MSDQKYKEKIPNYLNPPSPDPLEMNEDNLWIVFFKSRVKKQKDGSPAISYSFSLADTGDEGFLTHKKIDGENFITALSLSQLKDIFNNLTKSQNLIKGKSLMPSWLSYSKKFVVWSYNKNTLQGNLVQAKDDIEAILLVKEKFKESNPIFASNLDSLRSILEEMQELLDTKDYKKLYYDRRSSQINKGIYQWMLAKREPEMYKELIREEIELGEYDIVDGYKLLEDNK